MIDYQNIFHRDHYPTPKDVFERMVAMTDLVGKIVLDPSCGAGNLLKYASEAGASRTLGCEINDKMRNFASTYHEVIGDDFFAIGAEQVSHVQVMLMNPPFSNQERHIHHAWEVAPEGCEIVSLCNSSLFVNTYRANDSIRGLVNEHGSHEELGNVFKEADERRTDCAVSVIRLYKPRTGDDEWLDYFSDQPDDDVEQGAGIVSYNFVRDAVNRYVAAVSMFDEVMAVSDRINALTKEVGNDSIKFGCHGDDSYSNNITRDQFKRELQKRSWKWLFSKFNLGSYVTTKVMSDVNKFVETQEKVPFTMRNIYRMVEAIVGTHDSRMKKTLVEAFDNIRWFSKDNVTNLEETWKTNSAHMVNKRFIVPYIANGYNYDGTPKTYIEISYSYGSQVEKINDVVKALCYLTGTKYNNESLFQLTRDSRLVWGQWYEWTFFRVRFFKKGTAHFEFLDESVWARFNLAVAEESGWQLPANIGKKAKHTK